MQVMMALGDFEFSIQTAEYQQLKTSMTWRWAEKARYLRTPAQQYHGPGAVEKTLQIQLFPDSADQLDVFRNIKALADEGQPVRLVAGYARPLAAHSEIPGGSDMGLWVITALDVTEEHFLQNGVALQHTGSLTIKEYGEDSA
jgi:phage protein U